MSVSRGSMVLVVAFVCMTLFTPAVTCATCSGASLPSTGSSSHESFSEAASPAISPTLSAPLLYSSTEFPTLFPTELSTPFPAQPPCPPPTHSLTPTPTEVSTPFPAEPPSPPPIQSSPSAYQSSLLPVQEPSTRSPAHPSSPAALLPTPVSAPPPSPPPTELPTIPPADSSSTEFPSSSPTAPSSPPPGQTSSPSSTVSPPDFSAPFSAVPLPRPTPKSIPEESTAPWSHPLPPTESPSLPPTESLTSPSTELSTSSPLFELFMCVSLVAAAAMVFYFILSATRHANQRVAASWVPVPTEEESHVPTKRHTPSPSFVMGSTYAVEEEVHAAGLGQSLDSNSASAVERVVEGKEKEAAKMDTLLPTSGPSLASKSPPATAALKSTLTEDNKKEEKKEKKVVELSADGQGDWRIRPYVPMRTAYPPSPVRVDEIQPWKPEDDDPPVPRQAPNNDVFMDMHFDRPLEVSISGPTYPRMHYPDDDDCSLSALIAKRHAIKNAPQTPRKRSLREKRKAAKQKVKGKVDNIKRGVRGFFRVHCASCCAAPAVTI